MTAVAIVGAAETDEIGELPGRSGFSLQLEAARNALADCGLTPKDIDGVAAVGPYGPVNVAHALGITPSWLDTTTVGGTSFLLHVRHAASAIQAGHCSTVLVAHGQSGRSRVGYPPLVPDPASLSGQFESPYGVSAPASALAVPVLRFMRDMGVTEEQLAMVAVVQREWAARNPRARMRTPISVADVLSSRMVAYPLRLLHCCLVTDGGGALVITSSERAVDLPGGIHPVLVLGSGESADGPMISAMADLTSSAGFRRSGRKAFAEAGISVDDVDHLMVYDAFAHLPLYGLQDLGFVMPGDAGAFVAEGNTAPGGRLPMNTNGGGLSYTHTGLYGMFAILESVRQLRGEAAAQVIDPKISVVVGNGGNFMTAATLVLAKAGAR